MIDIHPIVTFVGVRPSLSTILTNEVQWLGHLRLTQEQRMVLNALEENHAAESQRSPNQWTVRQKTERLLEDDHRCIVSLGEAGDAHRTDWKIKRMIGTQNSSLLRKSLKNDL